MPVFGSMATASCRSRPMSTIGRAVVAAGSACTSNTYPCRRPPAALRSITVSSQESQLPQGVAPPAQLTSVPPSDGSASIQRRPRNFNVVVPPAGSRPPAAATVS
jgi:hypothetical protein